MKKILATCFILFLMTGASLLDMHTISKADFLYQDREDPESVIEAIKVFKSNLSENPLDYESLWRLARIYNWMGDQASEKDEKLGFYEFGKHYSNKAIDANEDGIDGHYYRGVILEKIGETKGILNSIAVTEPIRAEMELILKYDAEHPGAHHILAELYRKAPGWPLSFGDREKSLIEAKLAVKYGPYYTYTHLGLGKIYMDMGRIESAVQEFQKVIDMELHIDYEPEGRADKVEASNLLNRLKHR